MCIVIRLKNGDEIETVSQFEDYFKVDALDYIDKSYKQIDSDYCLCCLDVNGFFAEHPQLPFEYTGDWREK